MDANVSRIQAWSVPDSAEEDRRDGHCPMCRFLGNSRLLAFIRGSCLLGSQVQPRLKGLAGAATVILSRP